MDIDNIKKRFYKLKERIDNAHVLSVEYKNDAKLVFEHILLDYHVKKDIIDEVDPNDEFYIILDKWIDTVEDILDQFYPTIEKHLKGV